MALTSPSVAYEAANEVVVMAHNSSKLRDSMAVSGDSTSASGSDICLENDSPSTSGHNLASCACSPYPNRMKKGTCASKSSFVIHTPVDSR